MTGVITIGAGAPPGQLHRMLADLVERDRAAAVMAVRRAGIDLQAEAVRQVHATTPYPPVDTAALVRSFRHTATPDGCVVENTAPQAVWMEYGTRPHMPPLAPMVAWATRKARGGNVRSIMALARGAQMSIARKGTAPRHFWQRALVSAPGFMETRIRDALQRAVGP